MSQQKTKRQALGRGLSALVSSAPISVKTNDNKSKDSSKKELSIVSNNLAENAADYYQLSASNEGNDSAISNAEKRPKITVISGVNSKNEEEQDKENQVSFISTEKLIPLNNQPRKYFNEEELKDLAASIEELGLLQPILVRKKNEQYEIIAGERRWRAAKLAKAEVVPVIIRNFDDRQSLEVALVENIQRANLSPIEEARAYQALLDDFNLSQEELSKRVGKNRTTIANCVRLLKLTPEVLELVDKGELSMGHARALLTIKEPSVQLELAKRCIKEGLSVREIEAIVSREVSLDTENKAKNAKKSAKQKAGNDSFDYLVDQLRKTLGTKVAVNHDKKTGKGKIVIHYYSEAEMQRLVEIIG